MPSRRGRGDGYVVGTLTVVKTPSRDVPIRLAATALLVATLTGAATTVGSSADRRRRRASTPSPGETESATEPTEPAVEPATGPLIRESVASVHVPEGWVTKGGQLFTDAEREPRNDAALAKGVYGFIELDVDEVDGALTLDQAAREARRSRRRRASGSRTASSAASLPSSSPAQRHRVRQHRLHHRPRARRAPRRTDLLAAGFGPGRPPRPGRLGRGLVGMAAVNGQGP